MASRVDIQISILKFNFQPRFWFRFPFPYRGWLSNMVGRVEISIPESDFDFQISISPCIAQYCIGYIILCLWLCRYVIYYTLHYVYTIYIQHSLYHIPQSFHIFLNKYWHTSHIFLSSLCNILHIFLSSFMQNDA